MPFMCFDDCPTAEELAEMERERFRNQQLQNALRNELRSTETLLWEAHTLNSSFCRLPRRVVIQISMFCGRDPVIAARVEKGFSRIGSILHVTFDAATDLVRATAIALDYNPALHEMIVELETGSKIALPSEEAACKKALRGGHVQYIRPSPSEDRSWPQSFDDVTPAWLATPLGVPAENVVVANVIPIDEGKTSMSAKIELAEPVCTSVGYGTVLDAVASSSSSMIVHSLFLKLPSVRSTARDIRMAFMREKYWYKKLLPLMPPVCRSVSPIAFATSARHEDLGMLLEDVAHCQVASQFQNTNASNMMTIKQCYSVAEALARLHSGGWKAFGETGCRSAFFLEDMALPRRPLPLSRLSRAADMLTTAGHISARFAKRLVDAAKNQWLSAALEYCKTLPHTLLHCDARPAHIFFRSPSGDACFVDWQRCGRGPCAADICNLLCFCARPGQLKSASLEDIIIDAYLRSWDGNLAKSPSEASLREEYKVCLALHVAFLVGASAFAEGDNTHVIAALKAAAEAAERLDVFNSASAICAGQINDILHKKSVLRSCKLKIRASMIPATFYTSDKTYHSHSACERISGPVRRISGLEAGAAQMAACGYCRPPFVLEKPCKWGSQCRTCPALRSRWNATSSKPVSLQCQCSHPGETLFDLSQALNEKKDSRDAAPHGATSFKRHSSTSNAAILNTSKSELQDLINARLKCASGENAAVSNTSKDELQALLNERLRSSKHG